MNNTRWRNFEQESAWIDACVLYILESAERSINSRGIFNLVLAGGNTPCKIYNVLRHKQTNWTRWHIWFGDERCLPLHQQERNSLMAAENWLRHVPIPTRQQHFFSGLKNFSSPEALSATARIAQKYSQELSSVEYFDLVLLGLGEDGHTASLFPGSPAQATTQQEQVLVIKDAPKPPPLRWSMSIQRLSRTRQVLFLVSGASKLEAVNQWHNGEDIPASRINALEGVDVFLYLS